MTLFLWLLFVSIFMCIHTVLKLSIDQIFKLKVVFIFIDKYSTTTVSNVTILSSNSVVNIGSLYNIGPSPGPGLSPLFKF